MAKLKIKEIKKTAPAKTEKKLLRAEKDSVSEPKKGPVSQLRQDLVTGDWVVIATGRGKRPEDFCRKEPEREELKDQGECLFCDPEKSGQEKDV